MHRTAHGSWNTRTPDEGRHLILVDAENMAGSALPSSGRLATVVNLLRSALPDFDRSPRIVACNHLAALTVGAAFPGAGLRWRSGPDGADIALMHEMRNLEVMGGFDRITLCSGDHIFVECLSELAAAGIDTTVVSHPQGLSPYLRNVAQRTILLEDTDPTPPHDNFRISFQLAAPGDSATRQLLLAS